MRFDVTKEDLLMGTTVEPGWYQATVVTAVDELAKDGKSTNCVLEFRIDGPKFEGVKIKVWFSEKAPGTTIPLGKAAGVVYDKDKGGSFDPVSCLNKKFQIYVQNELYNNRMTNKIQDYRPAA